MDNRNRKKELNYIDIAHVICAISVVILHTNAVFWDFSSTEPYWKSANVIENVFYFAVPVFFMLTGATLLDFYQRYDLFTFFSKRIKKTVIPYIIWSLAGICFRLFLVKDIEAVSLGFIVNGLLSGSCISVFWFFIPLFCVYLSLPMLAAVRDENKKEIYIYVSIVSLVLNILVPFLNSVSHLDLNFPISISVGSGYLFYVMVGYLLDRNKLSVSAKKMVYLFGIIGLLLGIVGTSILSINNGSIDGTFKGYMNLPCVMYSIAVFILIQEVSERVHKKETFRKVALFLRPYTYPLYLLHWFIKETMVFFLKIDQRLLIWRLLGFVPILLICIVITDAIRKMPLVNKILP